MTSKFYIHFILSWIFLYSSSYTVFAIDGDPTCTEYAVTEVNIIFSKEALKNAEERIREKAVEAKQSFQMTPKPYSTKGWSQKLIADVQARVTQIINETKNSVIGIIEDAATKSIKALYDEVKDQTPCVNFSGYYTYVKGRRHEGNWEDLFQQPVGKKKISGIFGGGFKSAGVVGLGVSVTLPAELKGKMIGEIEFSTPGDVMTFPPKNKPSISCETRTSYDVTVSYEVEVIVGFTITIGKSETTSIMGPKVSGTLVAGKGHFLIPNQKDVDYEPICE